MPSSGCAEGGGYTRMARYLGSQVNDAATMTTERPLRVRALRRGWSCMRSFWTAQQVPLSAKRIVFGRRAVGAALSGCESYAMKMVDYQILDSEILMYGRKLLGIRALQVD